MSTTEHRWVDIPGAPDIPGLRFRFYRDEDDIPAMAEVANAFNEANGETERWSVEMMRTEFRSPTHIPPTEGMVLGFVGDRLAVYSVDRVLGHERWRAPLPQPG